MSDALPARVLKGLMGEFDAVVSGRMHLSIASLGMGVPVFALDYNDKAAGLLAHFGLDTRHVAEVPEIRDPGRLVARLGDFLRDVPAMRARIADRAAQVKGMACANFA